MEILQEADCRHLSIGNASDKVDHDLLLLEGTHGTTRSLRVSVEEFLLGGWDPNLIVSQANKFEEASALLAKVLESAVFNHHLDDSYREWSKSVVDVTDVGWRLIIKSLVIEQLKILLDLRPIPVEVFWLLLVLHLEKTRILHVLEGHHLLVPVVHYEHAPQVVKVDLREAALSGTVERHGT